MESHRPFEDWLLGDENLTAAQHDQLRLHLDSCAHCRGLAAGVVAFERAVREGRMAIPRQGFTARWVAALPERRERESRRQALWIGIALAVSAVAVGAVLVILVGQTLLSPWAWIVQTLSSLSNLVIWGWVTWEFLAAIADGLPSIVPAAWGVAAIAAGLGLIGVWLVSLYRLATQGATKGESQ